jgi:fructokinase
MRNAPIRLGVDLGGTKIEIVALGEDGRELLRRRAATPQGDYRGTLEAIVALVHRAEVELGRQGSVGVGTPGAISPATGLLKNSNSLCLNGQPLLQDLEQVLNRQVRMANDANCFALSEALDGAAAGASVVFGVIVGTGTGGVVVHGRVLTGPNAIAGEWGHNPLPWARGDEHPGPDCYCGKRGCIETFLSGPGMRRDHTQATGRDVDATDIAAGAAQGDAQCEETLQRYEDRMARSLGHVINVLDPDVIVLGGGMSNISRLYRNVPALWDRYVFSDRVATRLVPPKFGDASGARGAAWLWDPSVLAPKSAAF